jgi:cytochrome c oxidase subunit III
MNSAAITPAESHRASPATARFGMVIFLASEVMLFAAFIGGYIVLRWSHGEAWPPPGAPVITVQWPLVTLNYVMIANTLVLITSSFLYRRAEHVIKRGGLGVFWLLATMTAGAVFLSVQAWEWQHLHHEGMWFNTFGIYGSCFFVMTGFHGAHVLIGLALITWVFLRQLFTRCYRPGHTTSLDNVGIYWHFVDVVWIVLYTLLYVL